MKWFLNVDCVEELKAQYRKLCMKHHPDRGGNTEDMQEINGEYEKLFNRYKDIHRSTREDGTGARVYEAETKTKETPWDFINICNELFKLDGILVELCGRWLWIDGETMKHREQLKKLGCRWSKNKQKWSWHFPEDAAMKYKGKKAWNMDKIRSTFGSEILEENGKKVMINA